MITPAQCKMARAALDWSAKTLADRAGVGLNTINRFEQGKDTLASTASKIEAAFGGLVEFIPENGSGPGVRLKKSGGAS